MFLVFYTVNIVYIHIVLLLWHTYGSMECMYICMCLCMCVCVCVKRIMTNTCTESVPNISLMFCYMKSYMMLIESCIFSIDILL
jgi:hypothetical protein